MDFDGLYTFSSVAPGAHTLTGYLAKADHSKVAGTDVSVTFTTIAATVAPSPSPNTTPNLSLDPSQTTFQVKIGEALQFSISAHDPDGDIVTITIPNLATILPGARLE